MGRYEVEFYFTLISTQSPFTYTIYFTFKLKLNAKRI